LVQLAQSVYAEDNNLDDESNNVNSEEITYVDNNGEKNMEIKEDINK